MPQRFLPILPLLAAAMMSNAHASVDNSPKPGGVYPLKPGIYVATDQACETAPNAAILRYDGRGLSTAHTRACKATVLSRKGKTYSVRQTCIDAGAGPGPRFTQRQTVRVRDALTVTQTLRGSGTTYRYCPAYQLPPGLRP